MAKNPHVGARPVTGVVYSHSHIDHFGGVRGVVSEEDVSAGVPAIAPENFLHEAISENVFAGNAMSRRSRIHEAKRAKKRGRFPAPSVVLNSIRRSQLVTLSNP